MLRQVTTQYGEIKGLAANDPRITVFKGIPFAKAPVGPLRWKAPQPCEKWEGVKYAYEFGPISMQDTPGVGDGLYDREWHVDSEIPISEDSLYLNVWSGAKSKDDKLPVLVWYFGGAFQWGYTSEMEFNGERLARQGIIVVSVGYRLGAFGFLAHPELTAEDPEHPTNFGLLDQQAGLEWVYENISAFGGDPERITIAGQSAGGGSVLNLLSNPVNAKYVKGAAIFSGIIRNPFEEDPIIQPKPIERVSKNGEDFISYLGVSSIEEARGLDAFLIRDKYAAFAESHPRFTPCIDKKSLTDDPFTMLNEGRCIDVPIITGYTKDEFIVPFPEGDVKEIGEMLHPSVNFQYKIGEGDYVTMNVLLTENENDGKRPFVNMVENSVKTAYSAHKELVKSGRLKEKMYVYMFGPYIPGEDNPGAFHSCDLWFFFGNVHMCHRNYTGKHYDLSKRMSKYFADFVIKGKPDEEEYKNRPADGEITLFV